jgi:hypothetical protein
LKENSWTAITMTSRDIHSDIREGRERKLKRKNKTKAQTRFRTWSYRRDTHIDTVDVY